MYHIVQLLNSNVRHNILTSSEKEGTLIVGLKVASIVWVPPLALRVISLVGAMDNMPSCCRASTADDGAMETVKVIDVRLRLITLTSLVVLDPMLTVPKLMTF